MGSQENAKDVERWELVSWYAEAAAMLSPLLDPAEIPQIVSDIQSGKTDLYRISGDGWKTFLLTRIETLLDGSRELVLDAIAGSHCVDIVEEVKRVAKANGIDSIRYETHHPEKVARRFTEPLGFDRVASIYRVNL